ncbi:MAG: nodulation protein NfeD [Proteobacteria bacterium]|nr:nodulation protein NfeD [Pseudomonadota bacterium]
MHLALAVAWLVAQIFCWPAHLCQAAAATTALRLEIKGAIGPALAEYVKEGLSKAAAEQAALVILKMDTPGGLDTSMRQIIKEILASPVPVVCYVAPAGSRAASAGTYILYASHVAAMAPATNLGAATPIRIGTIPGLPTKPSPPEEADKEPAPSSPDSLERKMVNDAEAYIKALARRHGRNAQWAARAVREAVSLTAEEALTEGVIDILAANEQDLLRQLNNRQVRLESGQQVLATANLTIKPFDPSWRTRLLTVITDPNIAYILLLVGIYGLIFELSHPGFILPGVTGAIALLLALYTFQLLPINYAGLPLIVLGIAFMIAEAFVPSFGALGIGGLIAFATGSLILMNEEGLRISRALIAATALSSAAILLVLLAKLYAMSRHQLVSGAEGLIGSSGEAMVDFTDRGRIWIHGESWQAVSTTPIHKGQKVRVTGQHGLTLHVEISKEDH